MNQLAEYFSSNLYVLFVCISLGFYAALRILHAYAAVHREKRAYKKLVQLLENSDSDATQLVQLKKYESKEFSIYEKRRSSFNFTLLNWLTSLGEWLQNDKSSKTHTDDSPTNNSPIHPVKADIRYTFSNYVTAFFTVPRHRHYEVGILPAPNFFRRERISSVENLSAASDFIVRVGLILTFFGLAAALYSAGTTIENATAVEEIKDGVQTLIKTAAFKFVISVTALFCAVIIKMIQGTLRQRIESGCLILANKCDQWMPLKEAGGYSNADKTLTTQMQQISDGLQNASAQLHNQLAMMNNVLPTTIESALQGAKINIDHQVVEHLVDSNTALLESLEALTKEVIDNRKT